MLFANNSIYRNSPNSTFEQNTANFGGAIIISNYSEYSDSTDCQFLNNIAKEGGGALSLYLNSIYSNSFSCIFKNNGADNGGAIYINFNSSY